MQNLIVSNALKNLWQALPGNISKGISSLSQQRIVSPSLTSEKNTTTRNFSEGRTTPFLLPGGGLEKCQGRFKEEQYFNANDNMLLDRIRKTGYRLKCEDITVSNWGEYERMANACSKFIALRQTSMLNKNMNIAEESFFLQEQKGLLERILEVIRNLVFNRPRNYPPYGGYPHGSPWYGPHGPPYYHHTGQNEAKTNDEKSAVEQSEEGTQTGEGGTKAEENAGTNPMEPPEVTETSFQNEESKRNDQDGYGDHGDPGGYDNQGGHGSYDDRGGHGNHGSFDDHGGHGGGHGDHHDGGGGGDK